MTVDGAPVEVHRPVTVTIEGEGVTVMDGGREIQSGSKVGYGTVLAVAIADRTGYTGIVTASVGSVSGGTYAAVQDVAFAGTYTANTYSLTIRYTGAPSAVPDHTRTVAYGSAYSVESPAVTGYSPDTPVISGTMPAEDLVVEVSYSVQTYKLTVRYTGAPSSIDDYTSRVQYGATYSVESPAVSGYMPDRATVSGTMPASDLIVDVAYMVAKHTITWKDCGGAVIDATLVEYGSMPSHADPVRTGDDAVYVFENWTPALSVATADAEYTAVYKEYRHFTISQSGSVINGGEYWNVTVSESVGDGNVTLEPKFSDDF